LRTLAEAVGTRTLHVFARWMPDDDLIASLGGANIELIVHPLEAITQAALVSGQHHSRWNRAA
jgi:hypothetical protein